MTVVSPARYRVISDNDYAGDPDGLIQLAHHALCPSVQLTAVIGSQLKLLEGMDGMDGVGRTAADACVKAREVLELLHIDDVPVIGGSDTAMADRQTPIDNAAARTIIDEAMRTDDERPLFVCLGAGLTSLASAWLLEPRIAERLTAVWIGGAEYPDLAEAAPGADPCEYNTAIDIPAAQVVFNDSGIPLWQVPRDAYRQVIASMAELELWLRPCGRIGAYLYERLESAAATMTALGLPGAETYVLGDSPLVSLTALQTMFEAGPASSLSVLRPAPLLGDDGTYLVDSTGALAQTRADRPIRVFTRLDSALIIRDTYAKLAAFARREEADQ